MIAKVSGAFELVQIAPLWRQCLRSQSTQLLLCPLDGRVFVFHGWTLGSGCYGKAYILSLKTVMECFLCFLSWGYTDNSPTQYFLSHTKYLYCKILCFFPTACSLRKWLCLLCQTSTPSPYTLLTNDDGKKVINTIDRRLIPRLLSWSSDDGMD